uniref:trafficking protein particle complex subunit 9-like n=1 Tax=Styela clava TaxID=7725 RepID=UPI001939A5DB|nr:trafficking protein particle complex subunit 9-like [Styela clava]
MSVANYMTSALDHSQILIGVKYAANINTASVQFVLKKLELYKSLVINDAGYTINIRFDDNASPQNSHWGPLQAHRQVCGIVFIGEAINPMEAALILDKFNKLKEEYSPGLLHSRCIIFGIDTTIRPHSQDVFQFSSHNAWKSVDYDIKQFVTAIFYELESKRLRMAQERSGKPMLIATPFENPDEKNESDSKVMRKKCSGRHYKHLADVNLLVGQISEALQCYHSALDILIPINDTVWVGSALEGLCVVSALVHFASLKTEKSSVNFTLDPRNLSKKPISSFAAPDVKKLCISSMKDLVDRYREAIIHYSRYKNLAVIEMEACIKATKVFAEAKSFLEASEFIQNAVYITLNVSDTERLQRYSVMADLYKSIGFYRKSAFYKRVAAMQCVAHHIKEPDWKLCNRLLLNTISCPTKHSIISPYLKNRHGWPSISLRILHELVYSLEKINNHSLALRYLLYLILNMFPYLSETDEKATCSALENYVKKNINVLDSTSPELNFYVLPVITKISPLFEDDGMRPTKSKTESDAQSVFIYTPTIRQSQTHELKKICFRWCVNTMFEIIVHVFNPLSHCSIKISEFSLILDSNSSAIDCQPQTFNIAPQSSFEVGIKVTPVELGTVTIIGYAFSMYGVYAKCYFNKNDNIETTEVQIQVIGDLPLLKCIKDDKCKEEEGKPLIVYYFGEKTNLPFHLTNIGKQPICDWNILIKTKHNMQDILINVDDNIKQVSLPPGKTVQIPVHIEPKTTVLEIEKCQEFLCVATIKYAGNLGKDIWWRCTEIEMGIKTDVSIVVEAIEVKSLESKSCDYCLVCLHLKNTLQYDAEIHFKSFDGEGGYNDNMIPIECDEGKVCQVQMQKMDIPSSGIIDELCILHIKKMLDLSWKVKHDGNEFEHGGNIHLPSLLSYESSCKMINCPIECSLLYGNDSITSSLSAFITTNSVNYVTFEFHNKSNICQTLEVSLDVFQDQRNGYVERNLEDCVMFVGCTRATIQVKKSETVYFECGVLFIRSGSFDFRAAISLQLCDKVGYKDHTQKSLKCVSPVLTFVVQ